MSPLLFLSSGLYTTPTLRKLAQFSLNTEDAWGLEDPYTTYWSVPYYALHL